MLPQKLATHLQVLRHIRESEHYVLHFARRDGPGRGVSAHGVHRETLVTHYLSALERFREMIQRDPLQWGAPAGSDPAKTPVYVLDLQAVFPRSGGDLFGYTGADHEHRPFILLPCRNDAPTMHASLDLARTSAVHEGSHALIQQHRSLLSAELRDWIWWDEATALYMETYVFPETRDQLRFARGWIEHPETPLDEPSGRYQGGMFARFLANRLGVGFVRDSWMEAREHESALQALERLAQSSGLTLASPDPAVDDLFSAYARDSYFLCDPNSHAHFPDVHRRFGERVDAETFQLRTGKPVRAAERDTLDHLACRYFRFRLPPRASRLRVEVHTEGRLGSTNLKGEVAAVSRRRQRGQGVRLVPAVCSDHAACVRLSGELAGLETKGLDHVVLVVSNCGRPAALGGIAECDGQLFQVACLADGSTSHDARIAVSPTQPAEPLGGRERQAPSQPLGPGVKAPRQIAREQRLHDYLLRTQRHGGASQVAVERAWTAWKLIRDAGGPSFPVPDACPGPDGQVSLSWQRGRYFIDLEVFPDALAEFFFRDEDGGELWELEYEIGSDLPPALRKQLRLLV